MSKYLGETERYVRALFREARQLAPSVIIIDEIDYIGRRRGMYHNCSATMNHALMRKIRA